MSDMVIRRRKRSKHGQHPPAVGPALNYHSHAASVDVPDAPIDTLVERASGRRVYREVVPQREDLDADAFVPGLGRDDSDVLENDRYEMFGMDNDEWPSEPPPKPMRKGGMAEWRKRRGECLKELLRRDGCGDARTAYTPLHNVERWDGACFMKTSLKALGLRVQLGHEGCVRPKPVGTTFVVLDLNGIQEVNVDLCGCEKAALHGSAYTQLLRRGWYPATDHTPKTAATFALLDFFHAQTLQAKTTMYDFYVTLEKLTDNTGVKPPNRYSEFLRMARQYRHLLMLKRAGRAHDPSGVYGTQPGECAVLCPACPRPGVNLPDDWDSAPPEKKFLYVLFLALDACFRLKRRLISSELRDPGLGTGWAYFTENEPYRQYLLTVTDQKEMSTCSGLAALDYANTKFSRGYSSTGVGMGVCARHEFVQPTGVGDLQKGEVLEHGLHIRVNTPPHRRPLAESDIWWKALMERLLRLPPMLRLKMVLALMRFVIPKLHLHAHILACRLMFSLNFLAGAGQTDGEGIERPWANIGGVATSTREQGPGSRRDTLDDHWGYWNWNKLVTLAQLLRRRLDNAKIECAQHEEAFEAFSAQQEERVPAWRQMVEEFEAEAALGPGAERKCKNPYSCESKFSEEESKHADLGMPTLHDLEEEQRRVRLQAELKKAQTTGQQISLTGMRTKLTRGIQRFRKLQAIYTPAALQAAARAPAEESQLAEDTPLFLPSALAEPERSTGCVAAWSISKHSLGMRSAARRWCGCETSSTSNHGVNTRSRTLVARNESKIRLHSEKYQSAWNAIRLLNGGDPESVGWLKLRKQDIRLLEDPEELSRKAAKRKKQEERRLARERRLIAEGALEAPLVQQSDGDDDDDEERAARSGENVREISWIWTAAGTSGTDADLDEALRIEWAKAWARSRRWKEEVMLLEEEARRLPVTLEHNAYVWEERGKAIPLDDVETEFAEGALAYAVKQARMYREIKAMAETRLTEAKLANGKKRVWRRPTYEDILVDHDDDEGGRAGRMDGMEMTVRRTSAGTFSATRSFSSGRG
ncbi:hypothetical protein B0H13DRAFT_1911683 [Mycena leptocephala]|nr:hypothetical protein B0H13DRAFT_1911683 [Mycena leptocephala]